MEKSLLQLSLINLLSNRSIRVDRFDADYIDDLEFILNENHNIYDINDDSNEDFNNIKKSFPSTATSLTEYCNEIKNLKLPLIGCAPLRSSNDTKHEHNYDSTSGWKDSEGVILSPDKKSIEIINNLQAQYSIQSGGSNVDHPNPWGGGRLFEEQNKLLDTLRKEKKLNILTIGPRWISEVKFIRERFDSDVIGLDLFTHDENYIVVGDMHNMHFEDNTFDVVYQRNTFNKSYDIRKALSETIRVLKPGGVMISNECIDYTIGVNEIARTNITSNEWYTMCLRKNVDEVLMNVEIPSGNNWIKKEGTYGVRIKK
jgi:hypothetical protein